MRLSPGKTRKLAGIARKHGAVRASLFGSFAVVGAPGVAYAQRSGPRRLPFAGDEFLYACGVIRARRVNTLEQARLRLHAMAGLPVKPIEAGEFALQGSHGPGHVAD